MFDSNFSPLPSGASRSSYLNSTPPCKGLVVVNGHIQLYDHQPLRRIDIQDGELLKSIVITPVFRDPENGDVAGNIAFDVSLFVVKDAVGSVFGGTKVSRNGLGYQIST